ANSLAARLLYLFVALVRAWVGEREADLLVLELAEQRAVALEGGKRSDFTVRLLPPAQVRVDLGLNARERCRMVVGDAIGQDPGDRPLRELVLEVCRAIDRRPVGIEPASGNMRGPRVVGIPHTRGQLPAARAPDDPHHSGLVGRHVVALEAGGVRAGWDRRLLEARRSSRHCLALAPSTIVRVVEGPGR